MDLPGLRRELREIQQEKRQLEKKFTELLESGLLLQTLREDETVSVQSWNSSETGSVHSGDDSETDESTLEGSDEEQESVTLGEGYCSDKTDLDSSETGVASGETYFWKPLPEVCVHEDPDGALFWDTHVTSDEDKLCLLASRNINLTPEYFVRHKERKFDFYDLSTHFPWEFIEKNFDLPWVGLCLSANPSITWKAVVEHPEIPWDFSQLAQNCAIKVGQIRAASDMLAEDAVQWQELQRCCTLASNPSVTWEFVQKHPEIKWDLEKLVLNESISLEEIMANKEQGFDLALLSRRSDITWEFVKNNPEIQWDYCSLSSRIPWEVICQNWHLDWDFDSFPQNPTITWEIIKPRPELDWNYEELSRVVPWRAVEECPDYPWNGQRLSMNENITWEIVQSNPQIDWCLGLLLENPMERGILERREREIRGLLNRFYARKLYFLLVEKMSLPPNGYYFKKDLLEFQRLGCKDLES